MKQGRRWTYRRYLNRLEHGLHGIVAFAIIPLFALANAGVSLDGGLGGEAGTRVALGIFLGLVVGKTIGIGVSSLAVTRWTNATLPDGVTHRRLFGVGALGGIGFTMSLFIAGQAFPGAADFTAAKIAIFAASLLAGVIGTAVPWRRVPAPANADAA